MPVYKDKERGTYYFIISYTNRNGEYKQIKRRGFKSSGEAKRAEAEILLRLETDDGENEDNPTFEFVAKEYLKWYKKR
ncbi:MAG TPA: Arm DNA-binding domain-containing protein, partial [Chondromyces sp.]|nr:Arm DNA-binding domain-containing protein [Chondromyces sp.]